MVRKKPSGKETAVSISRQVKSAFFAIEKTGKSSNLHTSRNLWFLAIWKSTKIPHLPGSRPCIYVVYPHSIEKKCPKNCHLGKCSWVVGWVSSTSFSASLSLILRHHVFENWKRAEDAWKCSTKIETISMHKGLKIQAAHKHYFPANQTKYITPLKTNHPIYNIPKICWENTSEPGIPPEVWGFPPLKAT